MNCSFYTESLPKQQISKSKAPLKTTAITADYVLPTWKEQTSQILQESGRGQAFLGQASF